MFDTMKVARKIKEARIARNMTQMNLADAMEVSYQAVSNWERGSSCPDIGKLEQLCQILEIGVDELLGTDSASRTLSRIIEKEEPSKADAKPVTIEEIQEVAPLLPPADMARLVDDSLDNQEDGEKLDLKAIAGLAPFLDEKYLDALIKRAHVHSLKDLAGLAPFLSSETLDVLVAEADIKGDISGIISLAPFLGSETLDALVDKAEEKGDIGEIFGLAPFLSSGTLDRLVQKMLPLDDWKGIKRLAPFLGSDTLDALVDKMEEKGDIREVRGLAPFLSSGTLDRLVQKMLPLDDWEGIRGLAPFLGGDALGALIENADPRQDMSHIVALAPFLGEEALARFLEKLPDDAHVDISGLYPFLPQKTLQKMAESLMRGGDLHALKSLAPFL